MKHESVSSAAEPLLDGYQPVVLRQRHDGWPAGLEDSEVACDERRAIDFDGIPPVHTDDAPARPFDADDEW